MEATLVMSVTKPLTWNYSGPGVHSTRQGHRVKAMINLRQKAFASKTMYTDLKLISGDKYKEMRA
jgi:hypothetical protein